MKTVTFQIIGKYLDQIKAGTKVEEYRAISEHNAKLLCDHIDKKDLKPGEHYVTHFEEIWRVKKDITHVQFLNGYRTDRRKLLCEIKAIELNQFNNMVPEGMEPGTTCFTLYLGQVSDNSES